MHIELLSDPYGYSEDYLMDFNKKMIFTNELSNIVRNWFRLSY